MLELSVDVPLCPIPHLNFIPIRPFGLFFPRVLLRNPGTTEETVLSSTCPSKKRFRHGPLFPLPTYCRSPPDCPFAGAPSTASSEEGPRFLLLYTIFLTICEVFLSDLVLSGSILPLVRLV